MKIAAVRATPVNIPFTAPYRFSYGSIASLTKTVIELETEDGVIMAFEHKREPVAAVQFHPESIMTLGHDAGMRMIENVVAHLPPKAKVKAA